MKAVKPQVEQTKDGLFVVRLSQVPVNWDRTFEQAIRAVAPSTQSDSLIWLEKGANQYPIPVGKSGIELTDISLLSYDRRWGNQEAIDYATNKNLPTAAPQQVFAIGEAYPHLHTDLGKDSLPAVCLQQFSLFGMTLLPCFFFGGDEPGPHVYWFEIDWDGSSWFAVLGEVS